MSTTNIDRSPKPRTATRLAQTQQKRVHVPNPDPPRIFLLSPANAAGIRGRLVTGEDARSELAAARFREKGLPLGELFSFISGLYFRGKLAYARAFERPPACVPGAFIITACHGLIPPQTVITLPHLREMLTVPVDATEPRYRGPLERDARTLASLAGEHCQFVLLGSIATPKYVEPLLGIFGERLVFPAEFVGRGDMSRGGLMLRCVSAGAQLTYIPVARAVRHGLRPPKLPALARDRAASLTKLRPQRISLSPPAGH